MKRTRCDTNVKERRNGTAAILWAQSLSQSLERIGIDCHKKNKYGILAPCSFREVNILSCYAKQDEDNLAYESLALVSICIFGDSETAWNVR